MAQEVQIVPKFLHSHVETYINDYTQFDDYVSTPVDTNSRFICVFRSGKGIDNAFVMKDDVTDFNKTYGRSNFNKYGQPLMMPIAMLNSGSATVYCMRVMPDDAFAANSILCMLYKFDELSGKMIIKYDVSYVPKDAFSSVSFYSKNATFKKQLKNYAQALKNDEPDADGFKRVPVLTFRMMGRGEYGNNFRWRIARNVDYEYNYGIKMYSFEALEDDSSLSKVATYVGGIVASPSYKEATLINDILDDQKVGAAVMDVQAFDDYIEEVYDEFREFVEGLDESLQDDIPDMDEWDIFFGRGIAVDTMNKNMDIVPESTDTEDVSVDRPQGIPMEGGDDGVFASTDAQAIEEAATACYVKAFEGSLDNSILSTRRMPCVAMLDANYPMEVKQAMADLANTRESSLCYLDAGVEVTSGQINNVIEEFAIFNTRNLSKEFQHYTIKDPETGKRIVVTMTYFLAQRLADHYDTYGSYVPFVKSYSQLSGHIANSVEPVIDDVDTGIKELLYNNRINYWETIEENVYQRCSQNTAQDFNSDLMEENNMNTLFKIKSIIERDAFDNLYNFTSADEREAFTNYERAKFAEWQGREVDTFDIRFDVNEWEAERSIIHCYISVQFRTLNKRTIIEIDVNKRNFTS